MIEFPEKPVIEAPGKPVSAKPEIIKTQSLESVESILTELVDLSSEMSHLKENLISKGIPFNSINALVERKNQGKPKVFDSLLDSVLSGAEDELGPGAPDRQVLVQHIDRVVELDQDMAHIRKVARGHEMELRAVNMITQIVSTNPGDGGEKVLNSLVEYGCTLGIPVKGVKIVSSDSTPKATSVLPDILWT